MARTRSFDCNEALDRALGVFWRKGFEATSIQELVDAMGIGRQSLYDTYTDKRTLYLAALDAYDRRQRAALTEALDQPGPAREVLRRVLYAMTANGGDACRQGCFVVNAAVELGMRDEAIARRSTENQLEIELTLTRFVERGQADGSITRVHRADTIARLIFGHVLGLRVMMKTVPDPAKLTPMIDAFLELLA